MTVERATEDSTHTDEDDDRPAALVIGGGVAGMQAALDIANQDFKVYLLEKSPSIGGRMAAIDKTFPTLDCSACILTPRLSEVSRHPNIDLLTYSEVRSISGELGDFTVRVRKKARYVDEDKCSGCADCVPVCPVELPNDFDQDLGFRKAIYAPFPQATPNVYTIDKKGEPACRSTCPAHVNAQGFITMMKAGDYAKALEIVRDSIPFPGVLGRVCISFCEAECERGTLDESVSIRNLHRFLADWERSNDEVKPVVPNIDKDEKVAVIGSGPAGISCAYQLARMGYPVTVFEKEPMLGGLLRYGIPEYRLPRDILDEEIQRVADMGVKMKPNTPVKSIKELKKKGFKAVFVGVGASEASSMGITGEEADGVISSIDFLKSVNMGEEIEIGETVAVIGGGDAAIDSARVALRLGAKEVMIIYRRSSIEIPAIPSEVEDAKDEGIKFMLLTQPIEILRSRTGELSGVRCIKMRLGEPDHSGRRRPIPIPDSEFTTAVDNMIIAVGQRADPTGVQIECDCSEWATIKVNNVTMETNLPGVFAGGDVVTGPLTAVKAVGQGREAAVSIDRYLRGEKLEKGRVESLHRVQSYEVDKSEFEIGKRAVMPKQSLRPRKTNFSEVELGFNEEHAAIESERCLGCANCCECKLCVEACEREAIDHSMTDQALELNVGTIIMATGYKLFDVERYPQYGYGKYPNVIHAMEYERLINAAGPTKGHLVRLSDGKIPERIGFIQCVGARDVSKDVPYCSRVCCMYGIKNAVMAKEHNPETEVTVYYADIRAFGKGFEEFYEMARTRFGVNFVRGRVAEVMEDPETGNLRVRVEDTEKDILHDVEHDLIVISPGIQPPEGLSDMAVELGMDLALDGYIDVADAVITPVDTKIGGVFVCGCADGPKDIPDSVSAGSAAAMRATIILNKQRDSEKS